MTCLAIRAREYPARHACIGTNRLDLLGPARAEVQTHAHQRGGHDVVHARCPLLLRADVDATGLIALQEVAVAGGEVGAGVGACNPCGGGVLSGHVPLVKVLGAAGALAEAAGLLATVVDGWDEDVLGAEGAVEVGARGRVGEGAGLAGEGVGEGGGHGEHDGEEDVLHF